MWARALVIWLTVVTGIDIHAQMSVDDANKRLRERDAARRARIDDQERERRAATERERELWRQVAIADAQRLARIQYHVIPICGGIGTEVLAVDVAEAFDQARAKGAKCIVLYFDSPGGLVSEKDRIVAVLRRNKDIRTVAYARRAYSAAAILAMVCNEIYMPRDGVIGAAVVIEPDGIGGHRAVDAKMQAAFRASDRAAATLGAHPTVFVDAMCDLDVEVFVSNVNGKPTVSAQRLDSSDRQIKRRGEILALTGEEAEGCGLATQVCADLNAVAVSLGLPPQNNEIGDEAALMASRAAQNLRSVARREYFARVSVILGDLDQRIEALRAKAIGELRTADGLNADYQTDRQTLDRGYRLALARIDLSARNASSQTSALITFHQQKLAELDARYLPAIRGANGRLDDLLNQKADLEAELSRIVAAAPR
jgi:ATP-dependent protease ClpP protease subunit